MYWLSRLNEMKKTAGMTTDDIVNLTGLPKGTLNKIFAGQTKNPQLSTIRTIVHSMGYTLDDLEPDQKKSSEPAATDSEDMSETRKIELASDLYKTLIALGLVREGQELSKKQIELLKGIILILNAEFEESE